MLQFDPSPCRSIPTLNLRIYNACECVCIKHVVIYLMYEANYENIVKKDKVVSSMKKIWLEGG